MTWKDFLTPDELKDLMYFERKRNEAQRCAKRYTKRIRALTSQGIRRRKAAETPE